MVPYHHRDTKLLLFRHNIWYVRITKPNLMVNLNLVSVSQHEGYHRKLFHSLITYTHTHNLCKNLLVRPSL